MTPTTALQQPLPQQKSPAPQETPKQERITKYNKPHMIIPAEDMEWALQQRPPVLKLWNECWLSDPYGSRWMPLKTSMGRESFKKAKRPLMEAGLFLFKCEMTLADGDRHYEWYVKNVHGSRSAYWRFKEPTPNPPSRTDKPQGKTEDTSRKIEDTPRKSENTPAETPTTEGRNDSTPQQTSTPLAEAVSERLSISSVTLHKHFNILSLEAKGEFLDFCLKEMAKEKFEIRRPAAWIAANFSDYWDKFNRSRGEAAAPSFDWANHPLKEQWIAEMLIGVPRFVALGGPSEERQLRRKFADWAIANKLIPWRD